MSYEPRNRSAAPYVGNVIAPHPGACFRYVSDEPHGGFPMRCPEAVTFRGVVVNPAGKRIVVDAGDVHADDLTERRPLTATTQQRCWVP